MMDVAKMACFGCAHSSVLEEYPSSPSGERPCTFCIRNQDHDIKLLGCWYDGSEAVKLPMDCYHSLDMKDQIDLWLNNM